MKQYSDITILLTVLLLFSASIGFLHGLRKKDNVQNAHFDKAIQHNVDAQNMLPEQALGYLKPFLQTRGVGMLAGAINQFPKSIIYDLVCMIAYDGKSPLTNKDKRKLMFALAYEYQSDRLFQFKLFNLLVESHSLDRHTSLLLDVAKSEYVAVLPTLLSWAKQKKTRQLIAYEQVSPGQTLLIQNALFGAVAENDLHTLELLNAHGVRIQTECASDLLTRVIYDQKNVDFIPFLINRGADVNAVGYDKHTLLTKAVSHNDTVAVRTLLESGADVNLVADPQIGSAMSIAKMCGFYDVEQLLREYESRS